MMVEMSATPASIAARYSVTEQAVQWLLDNRGSGGEGDGETAELLKELYKAMVLNASDHPTDAPWEDALVYTGDFSLHVTLFGLDTSHAKVCQDGKGFYSRVFSDSETRWAGTGSYYASSLANDVFGESNTGYLDRVRSQNMRSLAQAVFKTSANIASGKTIIDRIATVQTAVDDLADNAETAINALTTSLNAYKTSNNSAINELAGRISALEQRLTNAGIP
ncbi:hypothetical protein E0H39_29785 [Rhizobium leguminosarum bv. viciae]|uniref:hypothetical protein n=2 Tax=Rhizobium TaxID=379 RepID=UPI00103E0D18|nr:hypothetical protein [Rhizobium leguminosarum]TBY57699.1 hypothetical protein E0H39_29785 [Rhizobium leguminosarum bv. viciae]